MSDDDKKAALPPLPDWAEALLPKPKQEGSPRPGLPLPDDAVDALIREASGNQSPLVGTAFAVSKPVNKSSNIEAAGHDGQALIVKFTNGRLYRYPTAGPDVCSALLSAPSAGQYFHHRIKSVHQPE
jgi:KTSC domain